MTRPRHLDSLYRYCEGLVQRAGMTLANGTVFAKLLAKNDDSGRHGVLVPIEAYDQFPMLEIVDPSQNRTEKFHGFDCLDNKPRALNYKYYQRYPERRITCLNGAFSDHEHGQRLAVFLRTEHSDGTIGYYADLARQGVDADYEVLAGLIFGTALTQQPGLFILRSIDSPVFRPDAALNDLLGKFDDIHGRGWIDSLRTGDTGIGYTFESLLGIRENNDKQADYRGIEIKCKQVKQTGGGGKINLFQQAPIWAQKTSGAERIRSVGQADSGTGLYACYSQVTTTANNLGLLLTPQSDHKRIELLKLGNNLGHWPFDVLDERLQEKHSRAVFIKAEVRNGARGQCFRYAELIYCERPAISSFVDLVRNRRIVFEFTMSEKPDGQIRNHGYPWRLLGEGWLTELFSLQVKLRGSAK